MLTVLAMLYGFVDKDKEVRETFLQVLLLNFSLQNKSLVCQESGCSAFDLLRLPQFQLAKLPKSLLCLAGAAAVQICCPDASLLP